MGTKDDLRERIAAQRSAREDARAFMGAPGSVDNDASDVMGAFVALVEAMLRTAANNDDERIDGFAWVDDGSPDVARGWLVDDYDTVVAGLSTLTRGDGFCIIRLEPELAPSYVVERARIIRRERLAKPEWESGADA